MEKNFDKEKIINLTYTQKNVQRLLENIFNKGKNNQFNFSILYLKRTLLINSDIIIGFSFNLLK